MFTGLRLSLPQPSAPHKNCITDGRYIRGTTQSRDRWPRIAQLAPKLGFDSPESLEPRKSARLITTTLSSALGLMRLWGACNSPHEYRWILLLKYYLRWVVQYAAEAQSVHLGLRDYDRPTIHQFGHIYKWRIRRTLLKAFGESTLSFQTAREARSFCYRKTPQDIYVY